MPTIWSRVRDQQTTRRQNERRRRFAIEPLEGRQMLSAFTVTNTNDSGTGSSAAGDHQLQPCQGAEHDQFQYPRRRLPGDRLAVGAAADAPTQ